MSKINIITGKIRSGKTTFLKNLVASLNNTEGILQPTIGDERYFQDIKSQETRKITLNVGNESAIIIGRFIFDGNVFNWAKEKLKDAICGNAKTIVIDEFGPLELNEGGLEPLVSEIVKEILLNNDKKLIIVIRETLVNDFLSKFNFSQSDVEITEIKNFEPI
jgi:nucleoside-triphosphatase THEP1